MILAAPGTPCGNLPVHLAFGHGEQVDCSAPLTPGIARQPGHRLERLARDGCNIIFTTSFGFMEPTLKVAKKFPDVKFEHATGYKTAENVTTYNAKFHEGRYVIGQIAAKGKPRKAAE